MSNNIFYCLFSQEGAKSKYGFRFYDQDGLVCGSPAPVIKVLLRELLPNCPLEKCKIQVDHGGQRLGFVDFSWFVQLSAQ